MIVQFGGCVRSNLRFHAMGSKKVLMLSYIYFLGGGLVFKSSDFSEGSGSE